MKIMDLEIDFPDIEGYSCKQEWYANQLRNKYVTAHEERFREINETMCRELDHRDLDYHDENPLPTFDLEFNDEEMACLFVVDAGGVIAMLKDSVHDEHKR